MKRSKKKMQTSMVCRLTKIGWVDRKIGKYSIYSWDWIDSEFIIYLETTQVITSSKKMIWGQANGRDWVKRL